MNMWASATTFTRGDLRKAFDDYAEAHGREIAKLTLERSTGAREVSAAPAGRILNAMVELVGGYSFVNCRQRTSCETTRFARLHSELASIREQTFARLKRSEVHEA